MNLSDYLGIWQLNSKGDSIPLAYETLLREIRKLAPDESAVQIVSQMEADGLIETSVTGERFLTDTGLSRRVPLPCRPTPAPLAADPEKCWTRFRRLCDYYADCVHQSEKTQEYLFANDLNNKFMLPILPVDWINRDGPIEINPGNKQKVVANRLRARRDDDEDVYLGYPLSSFNGSNGKRIYTPILLIPVDVTFDTANLYLQIRREEIDINHSWLEFNVPREEHTEYLRSICYSEDENQGLLNLDLALCFIGNRFNVDLNPVHLDYDLDKKGVLNSAALFVGSGLQYSKTLKKELNFIAKQPAAILDQTALAYVFREPPLPNTAATEPIVPLDFLPKNPGNYEQREALRQALNQPCTKVTGPPGTGKSQVAVNLIANLVFRARSVLFTSKNHKAIHAIFERASEVSPDLPLVQFCSAPDGSAGTEWGKVDPDIFIGKCASAKGATSSYAGEMALRQIGDALDDWRDNESAIAAHTQLREKICEVNECLANLTDSGKIPLPVETLTPDLCRRLTILAPRILPSEVKRSWRQKIVDFFLHRHQRSRNAEAELRQMFPQIAASATGAATLQKRLLRLGGDLQNYLTAKNELAALVAECGQLGDYAALLEKIRQCQQQMQKHLETAANFQRATAALAVTDDSRQKLKNAVSAIRNSTLSFLNSVLPQDNVDIARDAFTTFTRIFPAWASTLLSVRKASPCVAGIFDQVIIDEASQCEIPPIIPALFRARTVTVIGDPAQFPPVITLRETRHSYLRFVKHKLTDLIDERFDFLHHNAYDVVGAVPWLLREHFRCHADIADYFNTEYYGNKLAVRTDNFRLRFPAAFGFKLGLEWREVSNSLDGEMQAVENLLQDLAKNNYDGEIGVITPFRDIANKLQTRLFPFEKKLAHFAVKDDVNTANGFQGGERDVIIFMLALTGNLTHGQDWYAVAEENRYIYNVAASRARALLVVVGDRKRAAQSSSAALQRLAQPPRPKRQQTESPGEAKLYHALLAAGLTPTPQYPLAGRYLDLALVNEKIDIEVDGMAYHLNPDGSRKADDIYRDLQISAAGWRVCRFWHHEVENDVEKCVAKVQELANSTVG